MDSVPSPPRRSEAGVAQALADVERGLGVLERVIAAQRETIGLLAFQLAARTREVQELHELLRVAHAHAVPPGPHGALPPRAITGATALPRRRRPRWRRWLDRVVRGAQSSPASGVN